MSTCHVYERSGSSWQQQADVLASGAGENDGFCAAASMSGDTLLVGAARSHVGVASAAGAVYVFERSGMAWSSPQKLTAPVVASGVGFGYSVAVEGDTAVVGSIRDGGGGSTRGEVNVYRRLAGTRTWSATLDAPVANPPGDFGFAVAISESQDRIVASAPYDVANDPFKGVAYVFAFDGSVWQPSIALRGSPPSPPATADQFGQSVAFAGGEVVIGAPFDGVGGAVYVAAASEAIFDDGFD